MKPLCTVISRRGQHLLLRLTKMGLLGETFFLVRPLEEHNLVESPYAGLLWKISRLGPLLVSPAHYIVLTYQSFNQKFSHYG